MTDPKKTAAPKTEAAPKAAPTAAPKAGIEVKPGCIVFFDAPVFGEKDQTYAGLVIGAGKGRVRVKTLGLAADSADFPAGDVRLSP